MGLKWDGSFGAKLFNHGQGPIKIIFVECRDLIQVHMGSNTEGLVLFGDHYTKDKIKGQKEDDTEASP